VIVEVEDLVEKVIIEGVPEVSVSKEERKEIKHSIQEMKNGNYVSLDELKDA
jgi:hypothetical protein